MNIKDIIQFLNAATKCASVAHGARLLFISFFIAAGCLISRAQDYILLTNGDDMHGKLVSMSDKEVRFIAKKDGKLFRSNNSNLTFTLDEVYMIRTSKRGTTFIVDGKRVIRESVDIDKDADIIYLLEGKEIPAYNISLDNDIISFNRHKKARKAFSDIGQYYIGKVFMVRYSDGSKDIFTEIDKQKENPVETQASSSEGRLKVVFHTVKSGENLTQIANQYDVEVEDIKEWNELRPSINGDYRPKVGTQLMLQVRLQ